LINDNDLSLIDKRSYLNKTIYIGQDEKLENLKIIDYHKLILKDCFDLDKYEIICNKLNIDYNYVIENNGLNLSLGQRKKLLLVKLFMMYKNKDLIILDEIFAGLDNITKKYVTDFIKDNLNNKIVIIVDHESNLEDMDLTNIYLNTIK
jgi:ABC-type transport system involved in cytochrome bd biosynthesis fused ATPase/permease subunit